jgi:rhodanese-related sulfurtransferase
MQEKLEPPFRDVDPETALQLVQDGSVRILDVRSPGEYESLGHIPGAMLLPVDLIPVAPATLKKEGKPLLVCCEHGIRSAHAARLLARAGFRDVLNMTGGMSCWRGPRDHEPGQPFSATGPCSWLIQNADLLPQGGEALDVACGRGRHALLLAAASFSVRAVDRDAEKIEALRADAARLDLPVTAEVLDLETGLADLGDGAFDLILGIHYLHRPLFPALIRALRAGGFLLYETFTVDSAARGGPTNPDFLLKPGELPRLVVPLEILRRREGEYEGRMVSAVAARKPRG